MDTKLLTEMAFAKSGETSIRSFALKIGVSHVTVLGWLDGTRYPSFEYAAELAALANMPIIQTASIVRMNTPGSKRHKSILKKLASTSTVILIVCLPVLHSPQFEEKYRHPIHYTKYEVVARLL